MEAQILLGSNLGDRERYLAKAIELIGDSIGNVEMSSRIFVSEAWGIENAREFYNQAISVRTALSPMKTLHELLRIETSLGRIRTDVMASRTIDLDIAFWGDLVMTSPELTIPHPRLHLRNFALAPLNDIVPLKVHPVLGKSVQELQRELKDKGELTILPI